MKNLILTLVVCLFGLGYAQKDYFSAWYRQLNDTVISASADISADRSQQSKTASLSAMNAKHRPDSVSTDKFVILSIRKMLVNKEFNKLNALLDDYQKAYEKDAANENLVFDAYMQAFFFNGSGYEALLDEWVKNFPDHYQAYLARAAYFNGAAWEARGGKFASETSEEQISSMKNFFAKSNLDIKKVLVMKQNNIMPYYLLINIHKALGEGDTVKAIAKMALEKCPNSFILRSSYLLSIAPRWGGNFQEMAHFADKSQQYLSFNPKLALLQGYVFYEAGVEQRFSKNYGKALELLDKALSFGDLALFYEEKSRIDEYLVNNDEALADISTAIDLSPQDADLYTTRARIMGKKEMLQEAWDNIAVAERLRPNDQDTIDLKNWLAGKYYSKARKAIDQKDFSSAFDDLDTAIEINPGDIDYYRLMDWLLAKQSHWEAIIAYWDRYIEINSQNDLAYLERGGAYFHKGDLRSALADAKRAADLGNADGQKMVDRYQGQIAN